MRFLLTLPLLALWVAFASAVQDFRGQIQPNAQLTDLRFLGANVRVHLRSITGDVPDRMTWVTADGSFIIKDVEAGSYTLEVISRTNAFDKYRVDIPEVKEGQPKLGPQIRIHTFGTSLVSTQASNLLFHPLILHSPQRLDFFVEPAPFSLSSMLGMGSPMLILGVVGLVLVFLTPKLTAYLDEDAKKELADSQKNLQERVSAIQNGDVQSLLWKDDYKAGIEREKIANAERARMNVGH